MKPAPFAYAAARSLDEAAALLARHGGGARILAGGQSLVPMLNFRLVEPAMLIDINRVAELDFVSPGPDGLRIGALVRHRLLETSPEVAAAFPVLAAAMTGLAHLAIRNRGTLGGSLAHADPAAELPLLALLLEARIVAVSPEGRRTIAARDFFVGPLTTALGPGEILSEVELPALPPQSAWGYEKFARRHGDFAIAAAGVVVARDGARCASARIALGGVGPTPERAPAAETLLLGTAVDAGAIAAAAQAAAAAVRPQDDLHASADYRRHLVEVLTRRALTRAIARAGGETS
jgi:carbon-monoxide dehydrogenase medium subunit